VRRIIVLSSWAALITAGPQIASAATYYVDASQTATNPTGTVSFSNAFKFLEEAIQAAAANSDPADTILVSQGVYHPGDTTTTNNTNRAVSFVLLPQMVIKGGYRGIAGLPNNANDRIFSLYETKLSGDLSDNDLPTAGLNQTNRAENSLVVVQGGTGSEPVDEQAELEGLTIRDGNNATSGGGGGYGSGVFVPAGSNPTITHCIIKRNRARDNFIGGAGVYVETGDITKTVTIEDTVIEENEARTGAGLMAVSAVQLRLNRCTIRDNEIVNPPQFDAGGGGFQLVDGVVARLVDCTISGNIGHAESGTFAIHGAGGLVRGGSSLLMKHSRVEGNRIESSEHSLGYGGGLAIGFSDRGDIVDCVVTGNVVEGKTDSDGAGVWIDTQATGVAASRLINCTINNNVAHPLTT